MHLWSALEGDSYKKLPVVTPHSFLNMLETVNMVGVCRLVEKLRGSTFLLSYYAMTEMDRQLNPPLECCNILGVPYMTSAFKGAQMFAKKQI